MERFTSAIRQSLDNENWYSALYISLTLPDICARLESDNNKTDRKKFIAWYDKYLFNKYNDEPDFKFLSGKDFYALRCAMLHEGTSDVTSQPISDLLDKFVFAISTNHCIRVDAVLMLDVRSFCNDIIEAAYNWYSDFRNDHSDKLYRLDELVVIRTDISR